MGERASIDYSILWNPETLLAHPRNWNALEYASGGVVFGKRGLLSMPNNFMINHSSLDRSNHEVSHEHGFYEDGSGDNIGFGKPDGMMTNEKISNFELNSERTYDDVLMRRAEKLVRLRFDQNPEPYRLFKNNCQTFADKLRLEYQSLERPSFEKATKGVLDTLGITGF